jgi:DNA (cytosine-5)-methyltransferase 1
MAKTDFTAIDLFSGCGGLSLGLRRAGFRILAAVDADKLAMETYRRNHSGVFTVNGDVRNVRPRRLMKTLGLKKGQLSLLAGCPPCQGFSTLRTLNGNRNIEDPMNDLIFQFVRFIRALRPKTIMMENVPGLADDERLTRFRRRIAALGYKDIVKVFDASDYGVPQRRRRMILIATLKGNAVEFALPNKRRRSVKGAIRALNPPERSRDPLHNYEVRRTPGILKMISRVPKDGGSRSDLRKNYRLACHERTDGFKDVYGRMRWSDPAPTMTGGCINPSKGRFLHPEQDRAITLREAAMLQGFPRDYYFETKRGLYPTAQMIGNAFPPEFAARHAKNIKAHLAATRSK